MSTKYSSKLAGKRVVVIGGTSGMGYAIAEGALEFGAIVTIASSNPSKVSAAIAKLQAAYPAAAERIIGQTCDLSESASIEKNLVALFDFASANGQHKLDHIANTAGVIHNLTSLQETTYENLYFDRSVTALMIGKLAPRYLNVAATSSVTFTSGSAMVKPHPGLLTITPNVGPIEPLCRGLAVELAPIRFNVASPGPVATDLLHGTAGGDEQKSRKMWSDKTLLGVGEVEDVAEAYLYSMKNNFVTGTVIGSDGGALLK